MIDEFSFRLDKRDAKILANNKRLADEAVKQAKVAHHT